jgi:O-succinylbenzoic acid--CoA ligase
LKIDGWLSTAAQAVPEHPALVSGDESLTYGELDERARTVARRLATLGVGRGDRVALALEPSSEYVVLLHSLVKIGAVAVPLDPRLTAEELDVLVGGVGPRLVIRDPQEVLEATETADVALDEQTETEDVHCVIHTSGSGGRPKPVELTYGNHLWNAIGSGVRIGVAPSDMWLCCLSLHHIGGLAIVLRSALYRTAIVLEQFDPQRISERLEAHPVTIMSLVPAMLARLLEAGADLGALRCGLLGGGPAPQPLVDRALEAGVAVTPTYGLTEAASQVTTMAPGEAVSKPGSSGPPILTTEVRIADDGLICVRGPSVAESAVDEDGWLRTGDLGRLDEDGYLYVLGRGDEMIVSGGENISPEEVERVLLEHPAVADVGVAGTEDPEWQEAVIANIVVADGREVTEEELRAFCRERLAAFKVPKSIEFVRELPRNAQGKLLRRDIRRGRR